MTARALVQCLGILGIWTLAAAPASAQTITNPGTKSAATKPTQTANAKLAPKPAAKPKISDQTSTDYWAINTDLGSKYSRETPKERTIASRQPLANSAGSVGFTSGDVRNGTLSDGSTAAGMERYNQEQKSYVGMSLSLTSNNNNFPIPAPVFPRNNW